MRALPFLVRHSKQNLLRNRLTPSQTITVLDSEEIACVLDNLLIDKTVLVTKTVGVKSTSVVDLGEDHRTLKNCRYISQQVIRQTFSIQNQKLQLCILKYIYQPVYK
ncbi:Hypothetical_protein [Hexamita inflata]|uniref:Hypothetical_protein n=1 Tax=Hexamita inflata TaxID=28002 RepID=A0AA86P4F7_9EUKA|nr:Hypothetical protein HINF_LOCUS18233 [Hexamita inflata]